MRSRVRDLSLDRFDVMIGGLGGYDIEEFSVATNGVIKRTETKRGPDGQIGYVWYKSEDRTNVLNVFHRNLEETDAQVGLR